MRGEIIKLDGAGFTEEEEIVTRALEQVGRKVKYSLEYPNGGTSPSAPGPEDPQTRGCDCVGFDAWCGGFDRYQPEKFPLYDGYINTDSMIQEALTTGKWFKLLPAPESGCFIVTESFTKKGLDRDGRRVIGHTGVVTDASEWKPKGLAGIHVVHCSPYNYQFTNGASSIWKISGSLWGAYPKQYFIKFNRAYAMSLEAK